MSLSSAQKLILAFVTLILGIVFAAQVASQGVLITDKLGILDEQIDMSVVGVYIAATADINTSHVHSVTNTPSGWKSNDCPLTGVVLTNSSDYAYTVTTDYVFNDNNGTFTLKNTRVVNASHSTDNLTYVDYIYCGDDYMNLTWGRTGIKLIPGFFAIALLIIAVGLFYSIARENGIIGG